MNDRAGGQEFVVWKVPGYGPAVEYSRSVMMQIASAVVEAFQSAQGAGVEVGGLLYGEGSPELVRIRAWKLMARGSEDAPRLALTTSLEEEIARALEAAARGEAPGGMVPVGWAQSTTRRTIALSDAAAQVFERYFPAPWHIALIIRPSYQRPTMARFFVRGADGRLRPEAAQGEFTLLVPGQSVAALAAPEAPDETPEPSRPQPPSSPATPLVPPPRTSRRLALIAAFGMAGVGLWFAVDLWRNPPPPPPVRLAVSSRDGRLRISWDGSGELARECERAELEITDSGKTARHELSRDSIASGEFLHERQSNDVGIRLTFYRRGKHPVSESLRFLDRPAGNSGSPSELQKRIRELEAELEKARREAKAEAARANRLERALRALSEPK